MPDTPRRDGYVTATHRPVCPVCPVCSSPLTGRADQQFCSPGCRQKAHRRRTSPLPIPAQVLPAQARRGEISVYQCDDCGERLAGQQWCPDCQRPCRRLDFGGPCPSCGDPVTITELLEPPMT